MRRSAFYALCLLAGALLFGVAGLLHPVLRGEGAAQLATIASTPQWRLIHWSLLFGLPLMLTGLAGFVEQHRESPGAGPARAGFVVATFAFAVWGLNILFMAGAGTHLAATYAASEPGLASTHVVFLYDMLHPFGLAFYLLGWAAWNGRVVPRWLAWGAFGAGAACMIIALAVGETSVVLFYGQAAAVSWMALAGLLLLVRR